MAEDEMRITPLGAGQEVGRSCHLLEFRGTTVLLDCGIHPGYHGMNGLPYFDHLEPESVDVLLITHCHLDHAASLPYFTEKTGFKGRVFMTHPTRAILRLLLGDYLRLMSIKGGGGGVGGGNDDSSQKQSQQAQSSSLYTEAELAACIDRVELVDYHQSVTVKNLSFVALNAGHVLGAAMFLLEMGGRTVLYTGDYSMEDDRHLSAAEPPPPSINVDVAIVESTYGVQVHASQRERESRFVGTVEAVVRRGGKCLIPAFALGRAQELLLLLEEHWEKNRDDPVLSRVPIYYASQLAGRALRVYRTYANLMNEHIRRRLDVSNPFRFRHVRNLRSVDNAFFGGDGGAMGKHSGETAEALEGDGPCVVFASPGMLQSGVSRRLFDRWCTSSKNGVLLAGYAVENTLAKEILSSPEEVVTMDGRRQPLNATIEYVSFSAHVDYVQNRAFLLETVKPRHILLVHGQKDEMGRLKGALKRDAEKILEKNNSSAEPPTIHMPSNLQEVVYKFQRRKQATVLGRLAADGEPAAGTSVRGVLVTDASSGKGRVVSIEPDEVATYTSLRVGSVTSRLHVPYAASLQTARTYLHRMYRGVTEETQKGVPGTTLTSVQASDENETATSDSNSNSNSTNTTSTHTFYLHNGQVSVAFSSSGRTTGDGRDVLVDGTATVTWEASPMGDILADSVVALLMHAQSSPASMRRTGRPCCDDNDENGPRPKKTQRDRFRIVEDALRRRFETVEFVRRRAKDDDDDDDGHDDHLDKKPNDEVDTNDVVGIYTISLDPTSNTTVGEGSAAVTDANADGNITTTTTTTPRKVCTASVVFNVRSLQAKVTVECEDAKLTDSVRDCIRNVLTACDPLQV